MLRTVLTRVLLALGLLALWALLLQNNGVRPLSVYLHGVLTLRAVCSCAVWQAAIASGCCEMGRAGRDEGAAAGVPGWGIGT